jgi:uncharacterized membrane protein
VTDTERGMAEVEDYLRRLDAELRFLPAAERREIVLEARSHILERCASAVGGAGMVLQDLGKPEQYARQFMPAGSEELRPLMVLARLNERPLVGLPIIGVIAVLYAVAVLALLVAVLKLLNPGGVGLWIEQVNGARHFAFRVSPTEPGRPGEVLGLWLVALGLGISTLIHFSVMTALRRLGRWQRQR